MLSGQLIYSVYIKCSVNSGYLLYYQKHVIEYNHRIKPRETTEIVELEAEQKLAAINRVCWLLV